MRTALIPGSFDPFHNGHLEVVETASRLFDSVIVAAIRNPQKTKELFDLEQREGVDGGPEHLPCDPRVEAGRSGNLLDVGEHAVLAGPIDHCHPVGTLVVDDLLDQMGAVEQHLHEAPVDQVEAISDLVQV